MDIGKAFGQLFKDPKWMKKMLIFSAFLFLSFLLVGIPFVSGYIILILNNYIAGKETLPEWEGNWEKIFMTGLKYIGSTMVFMVVYFVIIAFINGMFSIVIGVFSAFDNLVFIAYILGMIQGLFSIVMNLVLALLSSVLMIRFSLHLSFSEVFDFDWYWPFLKKSWKNLLIYGLMTIVTQFIGFAGILGLCIGVFFTTFYSVVINMALLAEVVKAAGEGVKSDNVSAPVAAPVAAPTVLSVDSTNG